MTRSSIPLIYSARYHIDIGRHVFPTDKYRLTAERLGLETLEPEPATWSQLALVHTPDYLVAFRDGTLSPEALAELELPWSTGAVEGFRMMAGGTILAARIACRLEAGSMKSEGRTDEAAQSDFTPQPSDFCAAVQIGGGLHHAFPNHGEGFCPFNDVAVAVRVLQAAGIERHAIVDLDVHHGNGTAFIFESDPRVFTFSMHQQHNYPMWKPKSSLDIGLADGIHDATYLTALESALPQVLAHRPQCVFYLAGADPYEDDQLGGLRLTKEGVRARDRMVVDAVRGAGLPLVVTLAGGYARRLDDTVAIHCGTIEETLRAGRAGGAGRG